jgi:nucleoside-diphosphate-sugar epimerase
MKSFFGDKCVAVTGGLGLIGSHLSEELLKVSAKVIIVDDESKGDWRHIQHLREKVEFRKGTLENPNFTKDAIEGADVVFHLASRAYGVGFSQANNFEMFRFNDLINTNVLDAIAIHKPQHALVTSSSCVYPDDGPTPMPDTYPFGGEPEKVNWGYGWAKRVLEQKSMIYQKETGIPITVVRPFNVYGQRYYWVGESSQAIPMLVHRVLSGENPVLIWGSGNQRRTYIHALDCARVMMQLVENGFYERPINIGFEETISVKDLVTRIAETIGVDVEIVTDRSKPEGRFIKSADSRLLNAALGDEFKMQIPFREGIKLMVKWYHENFDAAGNVIFNTRAL